MIALRDYRLMITGAIKANGAETWPATRRSEAGSRQKYYFWIEPDVSSDSQSPARWRPKEHAPIGEGPSALGPRAAGGGGAILRASGTWVPALPFPAGRGSERCERH
jgi:hypothetical protein